MTDEIEDLRARVAAARERLSSDAAFARKVELRLDDLVRIVEGSLARQGADLARAEARVAELGADLERALARAEQAIGEAARAERLARENGELKQMVMTLLEVIEGRQKSPLGAVMQKLEEVVAGLVAATAAPQPGGDAATAAETVASAEESTPLVEMAEALAEDFEPTESEEDLEAGPELAPATLADAATEADATLGGMEDLSEIALYDASAEVLEPETAGSEKDGVASG